MDHTYRKQALLGLLAVGAIGTSTLAAAGDSPFGYLYTTDTHGKGKMEVEQSITQSSGQSRGDYTNYVSRTELEYGITDNLQGSIYLNNKSVNANGNEPDGSTGGKYVPDGVTGRYKRSSFDSVSSEFIYRVKSPYKDGYGLAFYVEPAYGPDTRELEGKVLLQKNFLDDRVVWATNLTADVENERYSGAWEHETETELGTGVAYRFAPHWHAGIEAFNRRGYAGHSLANGDRNYSAFYAGPSLHYAHDKFWATLSWLPQLSGARAYNANYQSQIVDGKIYHEAGTNREIRVKFGYEF